MSPLPIPFQSITSIKKLYSNIFQYVTHSLKGKMDFCMGVIQQT